MQDFSKGKFGKMAKFHNELIRVIDTSTLSPAEIVIVMEMIVDETRTMVRSKAGASRSK
jgi:hypothetical protein